MGTSNFYNKNASKVFAFEAEDVFDYEDAIGNIVRGLGKVPEGRASIVLAGSLKVIGRIEGEAS